MLGSINCLLSFHDADRTEKKNWGEHTENLEILYKWTEYTRTDTDGCKHKNSKIS
jgi:hypothetical protein